MGTKLFNAQEQTNGCGYKRNKYRNLVVEYFARNSPSVLAITRRHWPNEAYSSQPELARLLSAEVGWEVDYRSLSRQLRRVHRFDHKVKDRIYELLNDEKVYKSHNVADGVGHMNKKQ